MNRDTDGRRRVVNVVKTRRRPSQPQTCTSSEIPASEPEAVRRRGIEFVVPDQQAPSQVESARDAALDDLVRSAADNIPGVDVASISLRGKDGSLSTLAATDQVAHQVDQIQYQLSEGPCYAAVTGERLVLVNDLASASEFPRYG